jgi:hypothetical protein
MAREIRIGLMLAAAACLAAVLVDWVVEELTSEATPASVEAPQVSAEVPQPRAGVPLAGEAEHASVEAPHEEAGEPQEATEGSLGQG